jgi:hypothetical protein
MEIQGLPCQKVNKTPSQPISRTWWHTPVMPVIKETEVGRSQSKAGPGKKHDTHLKNKLKQNRAGSMSHMPSKCKALSSKLQYTTGKKKSTGGEVALLQRVSRNGLSDELHFSSDVEGTGEEGQNGKSGRALWNRQQENRGC